MTSLLPMLFVLALAGFIGVVLLDTLVRRPALGAVFVLATTALDATFGDNLPQLALGSANLYIGDVTFGLVLAAYVARVLRLGTRSPLERILILLFALSFLSLARGVVTFGPEPAVNEFRRYLRFLGPALYFAHVGADPDVRDRAGRLLVATGCVLGVIVLVRWAGLLAGVDLGPIEDRYDAPIRMLDGARTFLLASAFIVTLPFWRRLDRQAMRWRWLSGALLVMVILLNRRTVWLALLIAFIVLVWRNRELGRRMAIGLVAVAAIGAAVIAALPEPSADSDVVAQSATDTDTFSWRVEGWQALLGEHEGAVNWAIGDPFGAGFERDLTNRTVESNPHSFYVEVLLRLGVVGLTCLLGCAFVVLRRLWTAPRDSRSTLLSADELILLLVMQMVWWITWVPGTEQGLLFGVMLATGAAAHVPEEATLDRPGFVGGSWLVAPDQ